MYGDETVSVPNNDGDSPWNDPEIGAYDEIHDSNNGDDGVVITQSSENVLRGNKITNITGLDKLISLKELDLYYNRINSLKGLEKLKQLEILQFGNNKLREIPVYPPEKASDYLILKELNNLKYFDLKSKIVGEFKINKFLSV